MGGTRAALLEAGVALLHERGVRSGVAHVSAADVTRRAGYATSTLYRYWATQDEFHRDLAAAALEFRDRHALADTIRTVRELITARAPLAEVLRVGGNDNVDRDRESEVVWYTSLALRASAGTDPEVRRAADARVTEGLGLHRDLYGALLELYGREMRPPYTLDHLTVTIGALADGFAMQAMSTAAHPRLERDDCDDAVGRDWTLLSCVLEMVTEKMTRPLRDAESSS